MLTLGAELHDFDAVHGGCAKRHQAGLEHSIAPLDEREMPLAGRDETSAAKALGAELARHANHLVTVALPGSSAPLVEAALASGLRMEDPGLLLLSPPVDPRRSLAIHSDWLF